MSEDKKLLRFDFNQKYLVWDWETTSLNLVANNNRPWQLAFIVAQGKKILERFEYFLWWENLEVPEVVAKLTGFNRKKYEKNAVEPMQAIRKFDSFAMRDDVINVGHNILGFDVYMDALVRQYCGQPKNFSFVKRSFDTLSIEKAIKEGDEPPKDEDVLPWMYRYTTFFKRKGGGNSIKALCKQYEIDFDENKLHDASYDIEKNFEIFQKQLWKIEI